MDKIAKVIDTLKEYYSDKRTSVDEFSQYNDPFRILISCMLSLRTKDSTTIPAAKRLFKKADNIYSMSKLNVKEIEKLIYPVGFYRTKAKRIKNICSTLVMNCNGNVPDNFMDLLKLNGIGCKTAAIVMVYGHNKPDYIPVDVHVHVIANRLGWVRTKKANDTMVELMKIIPRDYWHDINNLFVKHGQYTCTTALPFCSKCPIKRYCPKIGINKSR